MKTFVILAICIYSLTSVQPAAHSSISQEHEMAIEVGKKFQKEILSKEQATEILISLLSDYSHPDGKLATLTQFINKAIGIENPVINAAPEHRGWSGCEVYWIPNEETKDARFFLKIFPCHSKHFLPEIFGLSLLHEMDKVGSPKISGLGQGFINETRCFFLLETPVRGTSIQHYFSQVGQYPLDSVERRKTLNELYEAVQACGIGLARFHTHLPSKKCAFPKELEETIRQDLNLAIEELSYQSVEGIEREKLQTYTENVLQNMKTCDHLLGLAYDDIKTIHTFYDLVTKEFSLVNPHHLYLSFNTNGEMCGLLIKDVCKYILSLSLNRFEYYLTENQTVCRKQLLTEEEVNSIEEAFKAGYTQGGGIFPTSMESEYISLQHNLFFIKNSRRSLPEPELTRVKDLITISLENIKFCLNKTK